MTLVQILPVLAGLGLAAYLFLYAARASSAPPKGGWKIAAGLSAVYLVFSVVTILREGLLGFWDNHSLNLWGNQVWIDLLFAIGIAMTFLIPEAKRLGMSVIPWIVLSLLTGCIGVLAMLARVLFLREREAWG